MGYYGFPKYVTVAEKKVKAKKAIEKLKKKNLDIQPIVIDGRVIAKTWWGKAWNTNMESYADFSNRISRGRSYVRSGAVIDLQIKKGEVTALVQGNGSRPYTIIISIDSLGEALWSKMTELVNNRIDSLEQLMEGKFPKELENLFQKKEYGLFPSPKEIHFDCSCPDSAYMCKHVAAVLYGIGARLDKDPLLFFELRGIDSGELLKKSMEMKLDSMMKNAGKSSERQIAEEDVFGIFGV